MPHSLFPDLLSALEQRCTRVWKPRSTVLFRRGEKASGIFVVLSGSVMVDFGVDGALAINRTYGPGALLGLPATLTRGTHSMTATVSQDAELGFLPYENIDSLLRREPDICRQVISMLSDKIADHQRITKALLNKETPQADSTLIA
jgi:CRP-like cAMP-binding protein